MPHLQSASLRPSLLALAIVSTLPGVTFAAADEITVTATGNARSAFEAPMMVSVIDATAPENQTASSAADLLRKVPGLMLDGTGRTNGQDVNLRGYDRRGVLVLVEGSLGGEHVPLVGFMLTLAAALSWACGNIFNKKIMSQASRPPIMSLVVWSALIPVLPFMLASLLIDGPQTMLASLQHIDLLTILSLLYLAFIATIVGYGIWGSLLGRYETWRVAPLSLLVPVVGMASAALLLGETLSGLQLTGAVLIMAGLYINVFGLRLVRPGMARG